MSVICQHSHGIFLDHWLATAQQYLYNVVQHHRPIRNRGPDSDRNAFKPKSYRLKSSLFAIHCPFIMDSQAERIRKEAEVVGCGPVVKETSAQRKRRKRSSNVQLVSQHEQSIQAMINEVLSLLITKLKELKHLKEVQTAIRVTDNNLAARAAACIPGCEDLFRALCEDFDERWIGEGIEDETFDLTEEDISQCQPSSLIGRCVHNTKDHSVHVSLGGHDFLIPGRSTFMTSSFRHFVLKGYIKMRITNGYDVILIDPPWLNKSVKRKQGYHMVHETDLKHLPMGELARDGCLVCVWITNSERLIQFLKQDLFPCWSVQWVADWVWVKVTQSGEPVYSLSSPHKKPYEQLIIGRFRKMPADTDNKRSLTSTEDNASVDKQEHYAVEKHWRVEKGGRNAFQKLEEDALTDMKVDGQIGQEDMSLTHISTLNSLKDQVIEVGCVYDLPLSDADDPSRSEECVKSQNSQERPEIPKDFILVSVPCSLHSKKPPLADILSAYLPANPRCLELFARNLLPGWSCWGNEPLRHQHLDYFEPVP